MNAEMLQPEAGRLAPLQDVLVRRRSYISWRESILTCHE